MFLSNEFMKPIFNKRR